MTRMAIRLRSFEDQESYRQVCDLLAGLYPERERSEFERALARPPCLLSHDADPRAAAALRRALEARGASVRVIPADQLTGNLPAVGFEVGRDDSLSAEIEIDFLRRTARTKPEVPAKQSARALPDAFSQENSLDWSTDKAPWE